MVEPRQTARAGATTAALTLLIALAVLGPWIAPQDPLASDAAMALRAPSAAHWFGTDQIGRDIFSRVLVATRLDLSIAVAAAALSLAAGAAIGAATGWFGGLADAIVGRLVDVLMAFPLFVLAMAIVVALGNSAPSVVIATGLVNLPFYVRLARAEARLRRGAGYVEAARVGGSGEWRILRVFVLPGLAAPLAAQASVNLAWAMLNAAGLSFIGLGVRAPTPEWGVMIAEGAQFLISGRWWLSAFPALALALAALTFHLAGDLARDLLDPRGRR